MRMVFPNCLFKMDSKASTSLADAASRFRSWATLIESRPLPRFPVGSSVRIKSGSVAKADCSSSLLERKAQARPLPARAIAQTDDAQSDIMMANHFR